MFGVHRRRVAQARLWNGKELGSGRRGAMTDAAAGLVLRT
jgi:hypothetical protein